MNEENLTGKLVAMHLVLAYLIACDAKNAGLKVGFMHEPLVQQLADVIAKLSGPASLPSDSLAAVEASASKCLDDLFSMASNISRRVPGPEDSQDG